MGKCPGCSRNTCPYSGPADAAKETHEPPGVESGCLHAHTFILRYTKFSIFFETNNTGIQGYRDRAFRSCEDGHSTREETPRDQRAGISASPESMQDISLSVTSLNKREARLS